MGAPRYACTRILRFYAGSCLLLLLHGSGVHKRDMARDKHELPILRQRPGWGVSQVLIHRDALVGHAEAIRTQSRKPSKAHTHKKRQSTNAGQPHSTRRKEATPQLAAAHAASEDTTHTSNHPACHQGRKRRPARHPPRAQQVPSQHTHN